MASLSQRYLFGEAGRFWVQSTQFFSLVFSFLYSIALGFTFGVILWVICLYSGHIIQIKSTSFLVMFSFSLVFLFRSAETDLISVCVSGCWGFQEKGGMKKTGGTLTRCSEAKIQLETEGAQIRAEGSTILLSG